MVARRKTKRRSAPAPKAAAVVGTSANATGSGLPLDVVTAARDLSPEEYLKRLGFPGEAPFTRGIRATMYRGRLWTMRQYAGFGTAKETNRRFKYLFKQGNEGLSVAFDLPTQMGYDSDAPMAHGEVGRVGVAISSVEDMQTLLDGLPLDRVSTSMTINATAAILLALYVAAGEARGIARRSLRGTVQNDILKEYIARSTYIYPPGPSMRLALDVIEFCSREVPRWYAYSVNGYHIREAGSTAAQEIGFTLANAIAYLKAAVSRGLDVDAIAPQISFFFNAHIDLLEEVAKFRAARRLWASIMAERFHAKEPESLELRFHAQTAGVALTAQQPEDKAVRVALRTQQLLAHESGVANTVDPVGGSFTIESLTDRLEAEAADLIRETDRRGGMLKAIETGWVQRQIADSAYRVQVELERGERTIVGVNAYVEGDERVPVQKPNPRLEPERVRQVRAFRARRSQGEVDSHLQRLEDEARSDGNLVPAILDSVRAKATLGEISDVLRTVFGTYKPRQEV